MKVCPECAFANEERFPTCIWCNAVLVNVKSTLPADPDHPEHLQRRLAHERRSRQGLQLLFATVCYAVVMTALAMFPGMIFDWEVLLDFSVAAGVIGLAVTGGFLGQFAAMFLQGAASVAIIIVFNRIGPFTAFALLGHVVLPALFYQWVDLIENGHG